MFIQTEATPNPATLKFIPGRVVVDGSPVEFSSREAAGRSPLAEKLFGIAQVEGLMFGSDFIAVSKAEGDLEALVATFDAVASTLNAIASLIKVIA